MNITVLDSFAGEIAYIDGARAFISFSSDIDIVYTYALHYSVHYHSVYICACIDKVVAELSMTGL